MITIGITLLLGEICMISLNQDVMYVAWKMSIETVMLEMMMMI
jgi:hypothetical protein